MWDILRIVVFSFFIFWGGAGDGDVDRDYGLGVSCYPLPGCNLHVPRLAAPPDWTIERSSPGAKYLAVHNDDDEVQIAAAMKLQINSPDSRLHFILNCLLNPAAQPFWHFFRESSGAGAKIANRICQLPCCLRIAPLSGWFVFVVWPRTNRIARKTATIANPPFNKHLAYSAKLVTHSHAHSRCLVAKNFSNTPGMFMTRLEIEVEIG